MSRRQFFVDYSMIVDTTWKIYLLKVKRRTKKRQAKIVKILENVLKMRQIRKKHGLSA